MLLLSTNSIIYIHLAQNLEGEECYEWATKLGDELHDSVDSVVTEHRCYNAFLRSHSAFETFRAIISRNERRVRARRNGKPSGMSNLNENELDLFEKLNDREILAKRQETVTEVLAYATEAERELVEVLNFEGGFLNIIDNDNDNDDSAADFENKNRNTQIEKVRAFLVPLAVSMSHSVFHLTGKFLYRDIPIGISL